MSLAVFAIAFVVVPFAPLSDWLGFEQISAGELSFVLLVLVTHVLVGFQGGLINGGFWCSGRYPLGMALAATTQLIEFAAMVAAVALGGGPVQAASAYLAGRVVGTALTRLALRRATPWLRYGLANASVAEIRRLAAPAFASLAFPLGNALNIQGMRLVVGMVLGPAAVAAFAALRTLTNFATQPRLIVNRLIEPELGVAFGAGNQALFNRLFLRGCQVALWAGIAVALALLLAGPTVWPIWTARAGVAVLAPIPDTAGSGVDQQPLVHRSNGPLCHQPSWSDRFDLRWCIRCRRFGAELPRRINIRISWCWGRSVGGRNGHGLLRAARCPKDGGAALASLVVQHPSAANAHPFASRFDNIPCFTR